MRGFVPLAVAGILSVGLVACGDDDDETADPAPEATSAATAESAPAGAVSVTVDGTTTEAASQSDALVAVSDAAGFEALPVAGLPDGFIVTALAVEPAETGDEKVVKTEVEGPNGKVIVTQVNEKQKIEGGTVIQTAAGRAYYEVTDGAGVTYYLVTSDRTYSLELEDAGLLARDQAIEVLRAFTLV